MLVDGYRYALLSAARIRHHRFKSLTCDARFLHRRRARRPSARTSSSRPRVESLEGKPKSRSLTVAAGRLPVAQNGADQHPHADTFLQLLDATGTTFTVVFPGPTIPAEPTATLAAAAGRMTEDDALNWRSLVSDFAANDFVPATTRDRATMLQPAPALSSSARWSSFVSALAEHLAFHAEMPTPAWAASDDVAGESFWWPVHGEPPSQRATSHMLALKARAARAQVCGTFACWPLTWVSPRPTKCSMWSIASFPTIQWAPRPKQ